MSQMDLILSSDIFLEMVENIETVRKKSLVTTRKRWRIKKSKVILKLVYTLHHSVVVSIIELTLQHINCKSIWFKIYKHVLGCNNKQDNWKLLFRIGYSNLNTVSHNNTDLTVTLKEIIWNLLVLFTPYHLFQ